MSDFLYIMMNKPFGYVCSTCSDRRHTIYELLDWKNCMNVEMLSSCECRDSACEQCDSSATAVTSSCERNEGGQFPVVHPVGRLDAETTGLIIITNDGMFNHNLTVPENHVAKTYRVELEAAVGEEEQKVYCRKAFEGVVLPPEKKAGEYFAKGAVLSWEDERHCLITISEGKFHQVRRTFLALGNKVAALERIKIGNLELSDLGMGKFLILSEKQALALIKNQKCAFIGC